MNIPRIYEELPEYDQATLEQEAANTTAQHIAHRARIAAELQAGVMSPADEAIAFQLLQNDVVHGY